MNPALFSSILFSLLALALADEHPPMDCVPTSCGNVTNITYPFWVDEQQSSHCGFPPFKLICKDQIPILGTSSIEYQVREIFYENQSVLLADVAMVASACPVGHWNLSFSFSPFNISLVNRELVFLFGCSAEPNYYKIPCDGKGTFAYFDDHHLGMLGTCRSAVVPVLDYSGSADVSDYARLMRDGFLLEWTAADCTACRESNGQCGYSDENKNFMCICPDRAHWKSCTADVTVIKSGKLLVISA